jgi:class 3 adenylate cyclase
VRAALPLGLTLEVWDEGRLQALIAECFDQAIPSFAPEDLVSARERIDAGKERLAFGARPSAGYAEAVLRQNLLWHFGTWRLRELRHARGDRCTELVPPGVYERAVVVVADLSGFTRYLHDTSDDAVVRGHLTSFYAKSRYQVINAGGMLVQFVGDEVVALFGIPDQRPGYVEAAVRTAARLLDIGASVAHDWQRTIDHVQPQSGVHPGMAMGRVQLVAMRALDHARLAVIGDCLNIAKRLVGVAQAGEIVASNVLRHALQSASYDFVERGTFEAHNLGRIQAWQLRLPAAVGTPRGADEKAPNGAAVPVSAHRDGGGVKVGGDQL